MLAGLPFAIALLAEASPAAPVDAAVRPASAGPAPVNSAPADPTPADPTPSSPANKAPVYGPVPPKPPKPPEPKPPKPVGGRLKAADRCLAARVSAAPGDILVCGQRPEYRIDPDIMAAKRAVRSGGPPKRPERMTDNSCASVGPMGCGPSAGINLIAAALTAAEMAKRLSKGQEIGSMFRTDPRPTEYQLYVEAKRLREAKEAETVVAAKVKAIKAEAASQAEAVKAKSKNSDEE